MGTFLVFILKSAICLVVFYLFYRLLLGRETFHRFNRLALLGLLVFSVIVPFIRFATDTPIVIQRPVQNLEYLLLMAQEQMDTEVEPSGLSVWLTVIFLVYIAGCLFFSMRFLYSLWQIIRTIHSGEKKQLADNICLVIIEQPISSFSWSRYIVISRIDMEENGQEIMAHEKAHIQSKHSYDLLLASLCTILYWFNPAAWLLKQELQNIHEYEADEAVLNNGIDAKQYQLLLIKKAVGIHRFTSVANSFNHSILKKRITMMLKQKSNPYAKLKYLYIFPLAMVAMLAFARPEISQELEKISAVNVIETPFISQMNLRGNVMNETVEHPLSPLDANQEKKKKKKVVPASNDTTMVVAYSKKEVTKKQDTIPLKGKIRKIENQSKQPLFIVDDVEKTDFDLNSLDVSQVKSFSILKGKSGKAIYGDKAEAGVILIQTKDVYPDKLKGNPLSVVAIDSAKQPRYEVEKMKGLQRKFLNYKKTYEGEPILIVDGKEMVDTKFEDIDHAKISSITILRKEDAIKEYGERCKHRSVIIISLKK